MSSSDDDKKDYDVGYGKPPKHTQWQKGQSGNPKGKKTKEASLLDLIKDVGEEKILVSKGGVQQEMSNKKASVHAFYAKTQSGNHQAFKTLAQLDGDVAAEAVGYKLKPADLTVLETHAHWIALIEQARAELEAESCATDGADEGDGEGDQ